ncbi:MAG: hypothetical protein LBQ73_11130 [Tannerellaceae bacterium]|jgi:hypothetical protein|nr:hypothetical protein [Tannerellaceae bacterium]
MKRISIILLSAILFGGCAHRQTVSISVDGESDVFNFAQEELALFLGKEYNLSGGDKSTWQLVLEANRQMPDGSFSVRHEEKSGKHILRLCGSDDVSALHAVYTFLEKAGVRFEITGPVIPRKVDITKLAGYSETIHPKVRQRGIRQHINFPMDVSSYPIDEAKEYIRNLARLRFNCITYHSYPEQWYGEIKNNQTGYAGHFFYGQRHDIPDTEFFHEKIRNKKTYCIPAIEPYFDDAEVRSKMASDWLRQLMGESKRTGLTIRFSFESRNTSPDIQPTVATTEQILSLYPQIDELELITQETLHFGQPMTETEARNLLEPLFGKEIMKDPVLTEQFILGHTGVADLSANIGHNIKALQAIDESLLRSRGIKGCLGLYIVVPEYLESSYHLLRTYAPDVDYAILAAHGARRVALHLPSAKMDKPEWNKTMVYSWLEFDGIMYIQQNGIRGIRNLIEYGENINGLESFKAMCFNHWRTAENVVTARYASEATLLGAQDETVFYTRYAQIYGIKDDKAFTHAMKQIDEADWYATTELPNVGFCYAGVWGRKGFGYFGKMKPANLKQGRALYEQALEYIRTCASGISTSQGKELISFLDNRLRATIVYLKAYEKGVEIQQYDENHLTPEQRKAVGLICNESILRFEQYLHLHAEMMPDRGCEGTLISAYHTPIAVLKRIRFEYGDIPYEDKPVSESIIDAPPAPILFTK